MLDKNFLIKKYNERVKRMILENYIIKMILYDIIVPAIKIYQKNIIEKYLIRKGSRMRQISSKHQIVTRKGP